MSGSGASIQDYLQRARQMMIVPNFWLTQDYLAQQKTQTKTNRRVIWIEEDDWALFPPLPLDGTRLAKTWCPDLRVWSDFENFAVGDEMSFLDWEYTYKPEHFRDLSGGKWKVFRKNVRKWPRANPNWVYGRTPPKAEEIERLLVKWLEPRSEAIEDADTMLWFALHAPRRAFLWQQDKLVGLNAWDANEPYLMYRYCITDPSEPFLDEFTRWLFYMEAIGWTVIDGGTLDNPGLERFKDKLNPARKRAVYSRIIRQE